MSFRSFVSVIHIPFVANFPREFKAYCAESFTDSEVVTFSGAEISLQNNQDFVQ